MGEEAELLRRESRIRPENHWRREKDVARGPRGPRRRLQATEEGGQRPGEATTVLRSPAPLQEAPSLRAGRGVGETSQRTRVTVLDRTGTPPPLVAKSTRGAVG